MAEAPTVAVRRLHSDAVLPSRMSDAAAGLDLHACLGEGESLALTPGERRLVPTGFSLAIPPGFEGQVRPRSGLALRHGLTIPNAPGTIDADYRGELKVILANWGTEPYVIHHGDRIAQLVIVPIALAQLVEVDALPETTRGDGGFGSTGRR